ncbi:DUF4834 family protein [Flavobacterium sp. JP2137]|uniref:DUF4834 family protein n=1 Tax=Flavobacterium sp. JP2137 TaxID=3414510 RepID=UPI003D2FE71D
MDTASFGGFLRTLLIIVLAYYAFRFIMRYLFPVLIYRVAKKANENFQQKQQDFYNKKSEETHTAPNSEFVNPDKPREKKKVGEYIEFEELD